MSKQKQIVNPIYNFLPFELEGFDSLAELALDMRWSWNHSADEIWKQLDPDLWELTNNPWIVLQTVSRDRLKKLLAEPGFAEKVASLVKIKKQDAESPAWFQKNYSKSPLTCVAYFSMEFMLSEALPIYSGGLGNVAGDQLKAASDLGVPVVGIGLLYQQGYFRQVIDNDGKQQALFPYNDPGQLPITPLRESNGEWLRLKIELPGYSVWLRTWQVQVGRVKLYLLDSNDTANVPIHQGITSELYGGGPEMRLKQELLLGIGGWRLLKVLGIKPEVCHLNEGHAAFLVLERALDFMQESKQPFKTALAATRSGNIFTTHTAVAAGFDNFSPFLIEQYLGEYSQKKLGIALSDLLALGRQNPSDSSENFNMAYLAINGSGSVNGVSRLHGKVSRHIIAPLFPRWPEAEVPVGYVTNGVHIPSWDSKEADDLWTESCNKDRWLGMKENLEKEFRRVSKSKLWQMRNKSRKALVEYARGRLSRQLEASGAGQEALDQVKNIFKPDVLTLGFARRFATYKRPNLLLYDQERFLRILTNKKYPVQLIIAGKAHPADTEGQGMITEWIKFIRRPETRNHVIFLSDYDMLLTERLVQGVDVWINNPRRPWEACGTSGMKVLVNGGINLSELDGWWAEAFTPDVGWALGDGHEHENISEWDNSEANALYDLLEKDVIPEFYERDKNNIPDAWVTRMMESMAKLTPQFCATRTVIEYTENHYIPAARTYKIRVENKGKAAVEIVKLQDMIERKWNSLRIGNVTNIIEDGKYKFNVQIYPNELDLSCLKIELYAEGLNEDAPVKYEMKPVDKSGNETNVCIFSIDIPATRPVSHFTVRVVPSFSGVKVPLELKNILWQR